MISNLSTFIVTSKNPFQIGCADEIFALHKTTKELLI